METLPVTSLLTGAAALFLVLLSFPIANHRRRNQLSTGDGGDEAFGGYLRYRSDAGLLGGLMRAPQPLREGLAALLGAPSAAS